MPDAKETTYNFDFDLYNPDVQDFIKERSYDFWESVSETTKNELRSYLAEANKEGKTINQISEGMMDNVFSELTSVQDYTRARKIARTETTIALNQGAMESYKQSGIPVKKSWLTSGDEDVRTSHRACEAQGVIEMDKRFKNGLMFPGDPNGAVKELVNCRCSLLPEVGEVAKLGEKERELVKEERFLNSSIKEIKIEKQAGLNPIFTTENNNGTKGIFKFELFEDIGARHEDVMDLNQFSQANREVLTYELSKIIGLEKYVPAAKIDEVSSGKFSAEELERITILPGAEDIVQNKDKKFVGSHVELVDGLTPAENLTHLEINKLFSEMPKKDFYRIAAFSDIIGDTDRHNGNWGKDSRGNFVFFDHGFNFSSLIKESFPERTELDSDRAFLKKNWADTRKIIERDFPDAFRDLFHHNPALDSMRKLIPEYKEMVRDMYKSEEKINQLFDEFKLPKEERDAFWGRIKYIEDLIAS